METELVVPEGWEASTISETGEYVNGFAFKPAHREPAGFPIIRIQNLTNPDAPINRTTHDPGEKYHVKQGSILVSWSATLDAFVWTGEEALVNQHIYNVFPAQECVSKGFLFHLLRRAIQQMRESSHLHGSTMKHINRKPFMGHSIAIPPLNEQLRIVKKLEACETRIDAAREALDDVPALLEQYRQSVLAAAFRGDLTRDWREANPDVEPASKLLERLRQERRQKWEEAELAKYKAKGKKPPKEWEKKFPEFELVSEIEIKSLPGLPQSWSWGRWGELSEWITYGFTRPMPHVEDGPPIVTAKNVIGGCVNLQTHHKTTDEAYRSLSDKDCPLPGDILITKDGTLGRCAIVPDSIGNFCINQSVAVVQLRSCPLDRNFLKAVIESPFTQRRIREQSKGNAIPHLSITDFAKMPIPIPPLEEQNRIARKCLEAFSRRDLIVSAVTESFGELDNLAQSLLAKAFRGELVPQDPNDEPASELLARIRGEREKQAPVKKTKKGKV